jgi:hypothetical protein
MHSMTAMKGRLKMNLVSLDLDFGMSHLYLFGVLSDADVVSDREFDEYGTVCKRT